MATKTKLGAMVPGYIEAEDDPLQMEIQGDKRQSLVVLLCSSCCDVTPSFCTACEGDATLSALLEQSFTELLLGLKLPSASPLVGLDVFLLCSSCCDSAPISQPLIS